MGDRFLACVDQSGLSDRLAPSGGCRCPPSRRGEVQRRLEEPARACGGGAQSGHLPVGAGRSEGRPTGSGALLVERALPVFRPVTFCEHLEHTYCDYAGDDVRRLFVVLHEEEIIIGGLAGRPLVIPIRTN